MRKDTQLTAWGFVELHRYIAMAWKDEKNITDELSPRPEK
jgi:hypothetical protein